MNTHAIALVSIFGSLFVAAPAFAQTANPAPGVDWILEHHPETKGVFVAAGQGNARHVQSGLVCPPAFAKLDLWHLKVYAQDGSDVDCDYGRNGSNDRWLAKLTIFATKAPPGVTVDAAFASYDAEIKQAWPGATATGPAITLQGTPPAGLEDIRSAEYIADIEGLKVKSDLVVAVKNGWVIEVRMSTATTVSTPEEAANAAEDMTTPMMAMIQAQTSIGAAAGQ